VLPEPRVLLDHRVSRDTKAYKASRVSKALLVLKEYKVSRAHRAHKVIKDSKV
jgi:hypothetical protein